MGHFAKNHEEPYIVLNWIEDPGVSNKCFDSEVLKKPTNKLILNPVKSFDKPNESADFDV